MRQINSSDLPETIQTLLTEAQKTGDSLTIVQNGIPFAIISPITQRPRAAFGVMKDSGEIVGDIVEPSSNLTTWDVLL